MSATTNAVRALRGLSVKEDGNKEEIHVYADRILLECVPSDVKKAYEDLMLSVGGFWYA